MDTRSPPSANRRPGFRFSLRFLFVAVAVVAVACSGVKFILQLLDVPGDAYATWGAGDLLLEYMEANGDKWPSSWQDLEQHQAATGSQYTMGGTLADLKERLVIDFQFNPDTALETISVDDFDSRPVRLRNGSRVHWEGLEPNERIVEYLRAKKYGYGRE